MADVIDELARIRTLPWHAAAWSELRAMHARQHHAVLLHGQAGIGKKGLALDFAASLLCESPPPEGRACGRCAGCLLFQSRNHPDLRIVVPDTLAWLRPLAAEEEGDESDDGADDAERRTARVSREIKIEAVRSIGALVEISAHRAGMRVVFLSPAEALNAPAANALLKMLEEPPPRTVFLLTSDRVDDVLPTIRSRCLLVRVAPPAPDVAVRWLTAQGVPDAADALAAAGGAPLRVLEQFDDDGTGLSAETARQLIEALAQGARLDVIGIANRLPRSPAVGQLIDLFQRWAWDLLALRQTGRVRYHRKQREILSRLAASVTEARLLAWDDSLKQARATADHPLNARLVVEALLVEYVACLRGENGAAKAVG
jgi:DNA polymerase-3 subunit delta'